MEDLRELVYTLQDILQYKKYIENAFEIAKKAISKADKDYDSKVKESFNYLIEVHVGTDIKNKFLRADFLERDLYKNSKKYKPMLYSDGISQALNQSTKLYNALLEKSK